MRYLLPLLLFAAPAFAQQTPQYEPTSSVLLNQALKCEQIAISQFQTLTKQITDLTKERDDLKARITEHDAKPASPGVPR